MKRKLFLFSLIITFILGSCGIDEFVYLEPPKSIHNPTGNIAENYFELETSDVANNSTSFFKGFELYYRIYESEKECKDVISKMLTYNESNPTNAVNYLFSSYKFKFLTHTGHHFLHRPLINAPSTTNRIVKFQLISSDSDTFKIGGIGKGKALRQGGEDFSSIKKNDYDVSLNNGSSDNEVSVAVFAVTYGFDWNFTPIYSSLVSLGYVKIDKPADW